MAESDDASVVELKEETEGQSTVSNDFLFVRIGDGVPVGPSHLKFDKESLPSRPLAVSERFLLVFVAHIYGFYVARTKDVMEVAKETQANGVSTSVEDLSIVNVKLGKVHILALSADSSTLSACVGGDIHFFHVNSLLNKEQGSFFSCSLYESNGVKDLQWTKSSESSFIVLSHDGKLYSGTHQGTLSSVTHDVDAAEWSPKGQFVAVARRGTLRILSSKFKERVRILLTFKSRTSDSAVNCIIKVDSIKWVRPECIVLGCFQLTADGLEENYVVQIITSRGGKIYDGSSKPVVACFPDLFAGLIDDIVPSGSGPHLIFSYLHEREIAFVANRKNTDQHIVLLGWSEGAVKNEAAFIETTEDHFLPRIGLQDDGEDNLVLGLCLDKVSLYEKVKVQEQRELSPYCVLLCLTLEGKLIMFHVASVAEAPVPFQVVHAFSVEEDAVPAVAALKSSRLDQCKLDQLEVSSSSKSKKPVAESLEVKSLVNLQSSAVNGNKEVAAVGKWHDIVGQQTQFSVLPEASIEKLFLKASYIEKTNNVARDFTDAETHKPARALFTSASEAGLATEKSSDHLTGTAKFTFFKDSEVTGPFSPLKGPQSQKSENNVFTVSNTNILGGNSVAAPTTLQFRKPTISGGEKASMEARHIEPLPSTHRLEFQGQSDFAPELMFNKFQTTTGNYRTPPLSGKLNSESNRSKQFGDIKETTKELYELLECIEGKGGFRDACTIFQNNSVLALEQEIEVLSDKCRMWKSIMDGRFEEIQHLLDKTVQVLARKIYLEGIVKQTTDKRYWELWDNQKLSSELELKQQIILKLDQNLTDQLIELERHFNTLELKKIGEDGGAHVGRSANQSRYMQPRYLQSLGTLYKTTNSQLVVAEKLSESLSKQMGMLHIESPVKQNNTRQKMFETIGIPYDDVASTFSSSSTSKPFHSSSSYKDVSRQNHLSGEKSCEPETARRRRDSLYKRWDSFSPTKTTVKRMLLQDDQKVSPKKTLSMGGRYLSPNKQEALAATHSKDYPSSTFLYSSGFQDSPISSALGSSSRSLYKWASSLPEPAQTEKLISLTIRNSASTIPSLSTHQLPHAAQSSAKETSRYTSECPGRDVSYRENTNTISVTDEKPVLPSDTCLSGGLSVSATSSVDITSLSSKSSQVSDSFRKEALVTKLTGGDVSYGEAISTTGFSSKLEKSYGYSNNKELPGEATMLCTSSTSVSISSDISSSSSSFASSAHPSSSVTLSTVSPPTLSFSTLSKASGHADHGVLSAPSSSLSSLVMPSSSPSLQVSETITSTLSPTVPSSVTPQIPHSEPQPSLEKLNVAPTMGSSLKLEPCASFAPKDEIPTGLVTQTENITSSAACSVISEAQRGQPCGEQVVSPERTLVFPSPTGGKVENLRPVVAQEDDMEEEVPETGRTTELDLGGLGAFGLGTVTNPNAPKPNPFGGPFASAVGSASSSSFSLSVPSGELFRPASFSFQPPHPSPPSPPTSFNAFSGGFGAGNTAQAPSSSGFGRPAQIGQGQQALGSVLGSFGQSRQLGSGLPGTAIAAPSSFGGGFAGTQSAGGFKIAASGGGFSGVASTGGGFGGAALGGGGFAGLASGGGGFGGGGFTGAAAAGGGFGAFGNQQGSGGFSAFGSGTSGTPPPSQLFTQMRK